MKLTTSQIAILDSLDKNALGVQDIAKETGLSISYVRSTVRLLEETDRIEKADNRVPHIYKIRADGPAYAGRAKVKEYKALFNTGVDTDKTMVKLIRKAPKSQWPDVCTELEAMAEAIRELETEGKLIDTL